MAKSGKDTASVIRQRSGVDDSATQSNDAQDRPGPVQPKASIRLHTYIGHQLFFGRQENANRTYRDQCFVTFAANLNSMWTCAQADDPYADARLILIEEQMDRVRDQLKDMLQLMDEILESLHDAGIRTESHVSVRPVDVPIAFRAVHAAVAVQLLGLTDRVIQKALACRHFGLVTGQDWQRILSQTSTPMRHLFELSRFRAGGATRDDFAANNARARAAMEKLGELPADVLQGLRRPKLGPRPSRSLVFTDTATAAEPSDDDSMLAQSLKALDQKLKAVATHQPSQAIEERAPFKTLTSQERQLLASARSQVDVLAEQPEATNDTRETVATNRAGTARE